MVWDTHSWNVVLEDVNNMQKKKIRNKEIYVKVKNPIYLQDFHQEFFEK